MKPSSNPRPSHTAAKAIAESHGGTLQLADEDGPGTVFVVELPLTLREEVYT